MSRYVITVNRPRRVIGKPEDPNVFEAEGAGDDGSTIHIPHDGSIEVGSVFYSDLTLPVESSIAEGTEAVSNVEPTLIIGGWSSRCASCGRPADPHAESHEKVLGYGPHGPGCGIRWTQLDVEYMGADFALRAQAMRPDLTPVGWLRSELDAIPPAEGTEQ
jgi:hypothetical protein